MRSVPQEYSIQKFFQYAGYPKYNKSTRSYYGGCPLCREGTSWGRKRRLYFILDENYLFCHNCGWSGDPIKFIQEVSNLTYKEIIKESSEYDMLPADISKSNDQVIVNKRSEALPRDSINLQDKIQIDYYKNNKIVIRALEYIKDRRLDRAINKPDSFWISLNDFIHKNRLVIPFYGLTDEIEFYQTRTIIDTDNTKPKYLSKSGSDRTLFNINRVDMNLDNIFIFEGPIDSCFVRNGVAMAGLNEKSETNLTPAQQAQLNHFKLCDIIWVLDSQWLDTASLNKSKIMIDQGAKVFIWPESYGTRFKDMNDMARILDINEIPSKFITENTYSGIKGKLLLSQVKV